MSDPILQLLAEPPAPPMAVDEHSIRHDARRRVRRRRFTQVAVVAAALTAMAGTVWTGAVPRVGQLSSVAGSTPSASAAAALDAKVDAVARASGVVRMTLPDRATVWVDPGKLETRSHMRMAARDASGTALGVATTPTEPVGKPYNVPISWSRTLMSDRLLVWGLDLEGTTAFRPDLHDGARLVSTTSEVIPGTHSIVYALDIRSTDGSAPTSIDAVTGVSMKSPAVWPPAQ